MKIRRNILFVVLASGWILPASFCAAAEKAKPQMPEPLQPDVVMKRPISQYRLSGPLKEVVPELAKLGKIKIRVDWAELKLAGVEATAKVYLTGKDTKFGDLVELTLAYVMVKGKPLGWTVDKDTLVLTSQTSILNRRALATAANRKSSRTAAGGATGSPTSQKSDDQYNDTINQSVRKSTPSTVEFNFKEARLEDVVELYRKLTGVNFYVNWGALKTQRITRDTPISFKAKNISVAVALDLTMEELNADKDKLASIYWVVDSGMVQISTGEQLNRILRTKAFDVADLLQVSPTSARMYIGTSQSYIKNVEPVVGENVAAYKPIIGQAYSGTKYESGDRNELSRGQMRAVAESKLINIVKDSIGKDMWYPNGKGTVKIFKNQLVVAQTLLGFKLMEIAASKQ